MIDRCDWICASGNQCKREGIIWMRPWVVCRQHKKMLKLEMREPRKAAGK